MAQVLGKDGIPVDVPTQPRAREGADTPPAHGTDGIPGDAPTQPNRQAAKNPPPSPSALRVSRDEGATVPRERRSAPPEPAVSPQSPQPRMNEERPTVVTGRRSRPQTPNLAVPAASDDAPDRYVQQEALQGDANLHRPNRPSQVAAHNDASAQHAPDRSALPTGWLVVIDGPGTGQALQLGLGPHDIGRGDGMRVQLNFGDDDISRQGHAMLTYDHRNNNFYIQQGRNLVYLVTPGSETTNEQLVPVLAPAVLANATELVIGQTRLRFIKFCDDSFSWH